MVVLAFVSYLGGGEGVGSVVKGREAGGVDVFLEGGTGSSQDGGVDLYDGFGLGLGGVRLEYLSRLGSFLSVTLSLCGCTEPLSPGCYR